MNKFKFTIVSIVFFLFCSSLNAQVLLNELMVRPPGTVSTPPNGLIYNSSEEYIELYNKGCTSINVSGYFIAMKQTVLGTNTGGTIKIPNVPAAIIPPGGHIVLASANPAGYAVGNVDIPLAAADYCVYNGNFVLANTDGWCALYNTTGLALDCVYWSSSAANLTSNTSDFNTAPLCLPTGSPAVTLQTPFQLNTSNPAIVKYGGNNPSAGFPLSRQQDGSTTWVQNLTSSISNVAPTGNCNGGTCVTPPLPVAPTVTSPVPYCQNSVAPLTATVSTGGILNWYGTNATGGTASATATPITTTVGTTTYYVSQTVGGCESPRAAIVVNVIASSNSVISCGTPTTTTSVTFNWTAATGATGYTISYQINAAPSVNVGAVGNVLTYSVNTLNSGDSVTITITPTGLAGTCFTLSTFSCATLVNNSCGACATPNCPIIGVSSYSTFNFPASSCNSWAPQATNTTLTNYYLVQSDASGFIGIVQQAASFPSLCIVRSAVIRPLLTSCNVASAISPSVTNANGVVSGFNPEWYGLTPNTQYVVVETVVLSATCSLTSLCTNYYGCSIAAPTASTTIQPTCLALGTVVVSAPIGANFEYSNGGVYQASPNFSNLAANTYTITVKNTTTGCISAGTSVIVNAIPTIAAPTASTTIQPTCLALGTVVVSAPIGANFEYSNGGVYQASPNFSNLAANTYTITVKNTTTGCISAGTSVIVNAIPTIAAPTASTTIQPTCLALGTVVVSAPIGANFEYSNGGVYQASPNFSNLAANTYSITVKNTTTGCISAGTSVIVNAIPTIAAPTASTTIQPTCLALGTVVVSAPIGANFEYSNGGVYQASPNFSNLAANTYSITVKDITNGCISAGTSVIVNAIPTIAAPTASTTIQPTCLALGTVVVSAPIGANFEYSNGGVYQASPNFSNLAANTYSITVKNTTTGCISAGTSVIVNAIPTIAAPTASTTIQPTCLALGTAVVSAPIGANFEYSNGGVYQASPNFSNLAANTYTITVKDITNGCISLGTSVIVNAIPTIAAPTASTTIQPTCLALGTVVVSAPIGANFEYSNGGVYQAIPNFSNLAANTYSITVKDITNGCISLGTSVIVNAIPTIAAPTASTTIQPTCLALGTVVVSAPIGANFEYSNGGVYQASPNFSNLAANTYSITVKNTTTGCISAGTSVIVNAIPTIAAPTASTTIQPTCLALGTVVVSAPIGANFEYSNGGVYQASPNFSNLAANTYSITVKNTTTGCISAGTSVIVNPAPLPSSPTFTAVSPICSGTIIGLPLISTNGVSGIWSPTFNPTTTTTYTFTPNPGQCSSTATLQVTIIPAPTVIATPTSETICSLQSTGIQLSSSISGTTFSWMPSSTAVSGATAASGSIISQVLTATGANIGTVLYSITPSYDGCSGTPVSVSVSVTPKPVLSVTPATQTICSGTATAITLSSTMPNTIYNWNVVSANVSGAIAGTGTTISQILTVGTTTGNAVYSVSPSVNGCLGTAIIVTVTVNPIPTLIINPILGQTICSGETTAISLSSPEIDTTFSWTAIQNNINGSSSGSGTTIAQTLTTSIAALGTVTYTITPVSNGCIGTPGTVLVNVKPMPEIFGIPSQLPICSGDSANIVLIPNLIGTTFSWTVNQIRVSGATNGTGSSINQVLETTGNIFGTVVYTVTPMLNLCSGLPINIPIQVNPLPLPTLSEGVICVDPTGFAFHTYILDTGLNSTDYTFQWSIDGVLQGAVGNTFEALVAGNYSVIATNVLTGCISTPAFSVVTPSFPATGFTATVTSLYFSENATITVTVSGGNGSYLFALDNGAAQTSNIFENVEPGQHTVTVTDTNGCTNLLPVSLNTIGYPTYFTPNGDGFHDTWNIIGLENQPTAKVYIFDRYGKLIKQISTRSAGWDGTYNGNPMPSSDYWFTIDYLEPDAKVFKAHFSLKR